MPTCILLIVFLCVCVFSFNKDVLLNVSPQKKKEKKRSHYCFNYLRACACRPLRRLFLGDIALSSPPLNGLLVKTYLELLILTELALGTSACRDRDRAKDQDRNQTQDRNQGAGPGDENRTRPVINTVAFFPTWLRAALKKGTLRVSAIQEQIPTQLKQKRLKVCIYLRICMCITLFCLFVCFFGGGGGGVVASSPNYKYTHTNDFFFLLFVITSIHFSYCSISVRWCLSSWVVQTHPCCVPATSRAPSLPLPGP